MNKCYISGPITGTTDYVERFNFAAEQVKRLYPDFQIINPVELCINLPVETSWKEYMDVCLKALNECTHIMMMDGWEFSKGATVEYYIARDKGLFFL